jgi:hypothetical protein
LIECRACYLQVGWQQEIVRVKVYNVFALRKVYGALKILGSSKAFSISVILDARIAE